jgi:hypothetical protein
MSTRREFLRKTVGAAAGVLFTDCPLVAMSRARAQTRREVAVNGRRIRTVDIHAHCAVPEALALTQQKLGGPSLRTDLDATDEITVRLQAIDAQGIDMQASSTPTGIA